MANQSRSENRFMESAINVLVGSPWIWGSAVTFVFYACLPYLPIYQRDLQRFFAPHWIGKIETGLFFVATCTLIGTLKRITRERKPLQADLLDGIAIESADNAIGIANTIQVHLDRVASKYEDTQLVKLVRQATQQVIRRGSAEGLETQTADLANNHGGRVHDDFAFVRTITFAIPILGLLGTASGITMALGRINPQVMESSFPQVAAGLAIAFDSTVLALGLCLVLVFGTHVIKRHEQQTVDAIEDFGRKRSIELFSAARDNEVSPLVLAEQQIAEQLLSRSETMINMQIEMWQSSLEGLRERWSSTLSKQQHDLDLALQTGLTTALTDHARQLEASRTEFVSAFRTVSESIGHQLNVTRAALIEQQQHGSESIVQTWKQFRSEITQTRDEHAKQLALLTHAISAEVGAWSGQLKASTQSINQQFHELRCQGDVFLKISENESALVATQNRLVQNLETMKVAESLEQTLLGLNAAVNLLTSRTKSRAA